MQTLQQAVCLDVVALQTEQSYLLAPQALPVGIYLVDVADCARVVAGLFLNVDEHLLRTHVLGIVANGHDEEVSGIVIVFLMKIVTAVKLVQIVGFGIILQSLVDIMLALGPLSALEQRAGMRGVIVGRLYVVSEDVVEGVNSGDEQEQHYPGGKTSVFLHGLPPFSLTAAPVGAAVLSSPELKPLRLIVPHSARRVNT